MKRFHVHLSVTELEPNVAFYTQLFGVAPSVRKPDYAKWMLDEPRLNFAMSTGRAAAGIEHLGMQVDSEEELAELRNRMHATGAGVSDEANASCCYARSDKHWAADPQGVAWEAFRTVDRLKVYGHDLGPTAGHGGRQA